MNRTIDRIKLLFLGLFAISCAAIWAYQVFWVWPEKRCEAAGDWWDWRDRTCAVPVPLWTITGRRMTPTTQVSPPIPPKAATAPKASPAPGTPAKP